MKQLSMMDKGFLLAESREVPMHVGGVALYTLPEGADTVEFLHGLAGSRLANAIQRSAAADAPGVHDIPVQLQMVEIHRPNHIIGLSYKAIAFFSV